MVKMRVVFVLALCLAAAAAVPQRIIGGDLTTIDQYPTIVSLLRTWDGATFTQFCVGTIINTRAVLTAAHCTGNDGDAPSRWRVRVGSTFANSGGVVHALSRIINHPNYYWDIADNDIAIVHTATTIAYVNNAVQPGAFAGANYNVADNQVVWAAGWGFTALGGPASEQLRHVQVWTISLDICKERYYWSSFTITDNMLCSGWLDVGGRGQCILDSGGPIYHNGIVIGVNSVGDYCADAYFPTINTRVPNYITWIQANA